jgi:hypothetical protein
MKRISLNLKATGPNPAMWLGSHCASGFLGLATQCHFAWPMSDGPTQGGGGRHTARARMGATLVRSV